MRFALVKEHKRHMPIDRLCRILGVTARGYRAWRRRPISRRQRDDMVLLAHIREQHHLSLGSYGRPRMTQELKELGLSVGHRRVGRLMRDNHIYVVRTHKYKATTDSHHRFNIAPNVLDRNFTAHLPNYKSFSAFASQLPVRRRGWRHQLYLDDRGLALPGCDD